MKVSKLIVALERYDQSADVVIASTPYGRYFNFAVKEQKGLALTEGALRVARVAKGEREAAAKGLLFRPTSPALAAAAISKKPLKPLPPPPSVLRPIALELITTRLQPLPTRER
jgi:hypothetical protein